MRYVFVLFTILEVFSTICVYGQKRPIDYFSYSQWSDIENVKISNDGQYFLYWIDSGNGGTCMIVQSTDLSWRKQFLTSESSFFTTDSRHLIFKCRGDSIGVYTLGTDSVVYISNVTNYSSPEDKNDQYLAYQKNDTEHSLFVFNVFTGDQRTYQYIKKYVFNKQGNILLLVAADSSGDKSLTDILLLDLLTGQSKCLCRVYQAGQFIFDNDGTGLVFSGRRTASEMDGPSLWYYRMGMDSAIVSADYRSIRNTGFSIGNRARISFSKNGERIFFYLEKVHQVDHAKNGKSELSIQGPITDKIIFEAGSFLATINCKNIGAGVVRLQQDTDSGIPLIDVNGDWIVTSSNVSGDFNSARTDSSSLPDIYLISTKDGSRKLLKRRLICNNMSFSPSGKYIIWFDQNCKGWFCYDIALNKIRNMFDDISLVFWYETDYANFPTGYKIAGWVENKNAVLIYDRYDIWQVDLTGLNIPFNLTHRFGSRNGIQFRYLNFNQNSTPIIRPEDTLILSAFDLTSKQDGFFSLVLSNTKLVKLTMSSHIYNYVENDLCGAYNAIPIIKAANTRTYILSRMSSNEYPNLYATGDFMKFKSLTTFSPQKAYNWYTTELIHLTLPNGKRSEGILFKPENFDSKRKYPIIFYYYEKNASNLNVFIRPALSNGQINIPWYVSNGYLVFVPDINYTIGYPGRSAYNSVVSSALCLAKMPWVDSQRMGLQGHSFGGFETNYIVSHSSLFQAAVSASGVSDLISEYSESDFPWYDERGQGRIGTSLSKAPNLYIENSAILSADKVSSPVLIMHTGNDGIVPYSQAVEWYNVLYRLKKKVWLVEYKQESHILADKRNCLDFSIRMAQFFDHFLKGAPAPKWMTGGLNAAGFEFDINERFCSDYFWLYMNKVVGNVVGG